MTVPCDRIIENSLCYTEIIPPHKKKKKKPTLGIPVLAQQKLI